MSIKLSEKMIMELEKARLSIEQYRPETLCIAGPIRMVQTTRAVLDAMLKEELELMHKSNETT